MSKPLQFALAAALLICTGCFTTPRESAVAPASTTDTTLPAPPPSVTADMITSANGHQIADALWQELDREEQKTMLSTPVR